MSALPSESDFPSETPSHLQLLIEKTAERCNKDVKKVSLDLLYRRYRGICWICRRFVPRDKASRDHIIPRSLGGTDDIKNLALAHKICNSKRGNGYNEISFVHIEGTDKKVIFLNDHELILQVNVKDGETSVILSKKREDWDNGNYRKARAGI